MAVNKEKILQEVIEGYRDTIKHRYQYQSIIENFDIPDSIDEETVNKLRSFFLSHVYPEYHKRQELNEAFDSLDDYVKNPQKLIRIVLDTTKLVFKYGRHLPRIAKTGLNALKTFKVASNFENNLVTAALKNNIKPPYRIEKINTLITLIPREEIDAFMESSQTLFQILNDRPLIKKITAIIKYVIKVMKDNPDAYAASQVKGLEIGYNMIYEGDKLFNELNKEDQQNLVDFVLEIEKDNLNQIF